MKYQAKIYQWIADVARLLPVATFRPPLVNYRDGKTRVVVTWNENEQTFIVASMRDNDIDIASPQEVYEHFRLEITN